MYRNDKKQYCGTYKGYKIWAKGQMIGNNWYGYYYATKKAKKNYVKVKDSDRRGWDDLKQFLNSLEDENLQGNS